MIYIMFMCIWAAVPHIFNLMLWVAPPSWNRKMQRSRRQSYLETERGASISYPQDSPPTHWPLTSAVDDEHYSALRALETRLVKRLSEMEQRVYTGAERSLAHESHAYMQLHACTHTR